MEENKISVKELLPLIKFLAGYHKDAREARDKIALATDLNEAKMAAVFEYPIVQGLVFSLFLNQLADIEIEEHEGDMGKCVAYLETFIKK